MKILSNINLDLRMEETIAYVDSTCTGLPEGFSAGMLKVVVVDPSDNGEDGGENPDLDNKLLCGTSANGDAVGYHGGTGVTEDLYGEVQSLGIFGKELIQLRALGDVIRLRFAHNIALEDVVNVKINGSTIAFDKEKGQPRYNCTSAKVAGYFKDGMALTIEEGLPEDVVIHTPGEIDDGEVDAPELPDDGESIEPPKENKPAEPEVTKPSENKKSKAKAKEKEEEKVEPKQLNDYPTLIVQTIKGLVNYGDPVLHEAERFIFPSEVIDGEIAFSDWKIKQEVTI